MYISDYDELVSFCERAAPSGILAVDTEFLRERTYYPRLCLIQAATHDESAAIDPLAIDDLTPLVALLTDERITKIFHACSQDLETILYALDVVPTPIFDTQLAGAYVGMRQQLGYGALVERYAGVHLPKADSLTDWSRRPLDAEQLAYAEDDVRYLPDIYDAMMTQLVSRNRLGWVAGEMSQLSLRSNVERRPEDAYLHLRRSGSLTRRQLAVAREVCAWREREAARRDVPRKWVVSDEVLVEVSKRCPKSRDRLRRIRGTEQLSAEGAEGIVRAVRKGTSMGLADLPAPKRRERISTEMEGVLDLMNALLRIIAEREGIAPQAIATRDDLLDLAADREGALLGTGWRHDVAGRHLKRLLAGEIGLTVKGGRIELL